MELNYNIIIIITLIVFVITLFVVQKFSRYDIYLKALVIFLVPLFPALILLAIKSNTEFNQLKNDYALSEGSIIEYLDGYGGGMITGRHKLQKVVYKYSAEDYIYTNKNNGREVEFSYFTPDLDVKYLVIYEKSNPQNSYLLFNYPINNSAQKEEYIKLFEKGIPENVFKK